ncbi:MAG: hypothetical protein RIT25_2360 [Planctomycetota bacterium]
MKRATTLLVACAVFAGCGEQAAPWPEPPVGAQLGVVARASATEVALLEPFTVEVDVWRRDGIEVEFSPAVPKGTEGTVAMGATEPAGPGAWQRTVLELRATALPGELVVPPFEAKQRDGEAVAASEPIRITIRSVLEGHDAAIEPPASLLDAPASAWPWFLAAGLLAAGGFVAARLLRPAPPAPPPPATPLPPHVLALREIEKVRGMPRASPAQVDAFYVALSRVLRVYVEGRFGLHAPERTTEEFLAEAERHGGIPVEQRAALRRFLQACDLVKFAGAVPDEAEHLDALLVATAFVNATIPVEVPAAPVQAGGPA